MDRLLNVVGNFFSNSKNMAAIESDCRSKDLVKTRELISNLKKEVVAEERWEIPSETQDDGAAVQLVEQQGVVVELEDGQTRYLVRRIPNEQEEGVVEVIVTYASQMEPNWVCVEGKRVQNAKLEDYFDQGQDTRDKIDCSSDLRESDYTKESPEDTKDNIEGKIEGTSLERDDKEDSADVPNISTDLVEGGGKGSSTDGQSNPIEEKMDSSDTYGLRLKL